MRVPAAVAVIVALWMQTARAADLLLRWTAEADAQGYRLYLGTQSHLYSERDDLGLLTADTIGGIVYFLKTGLPPSQRHFLAVTAYNEAGESDFSNEKEVLLGTVEPPAASAGADQVVGVGQTIVLGADGASNVRYVWLQRDGPPADLSDPTSSTTSFTSSRSGSFQFVLIAFDANGIASSDNVRITVVNAAVPTVSRGACLLAAAVLVGLAWHRLRHAPERGEIYGAPQR
jgi:hypothetical protein